jgi:hypothetical protein
MGRGTIFESSEESFFKRQISGSFTKCVCPSRRHHLLAPAADPYMMHMAMRSRKGYWRMSQNDVV